MSKRILTGSIVKQYTNLQKGAVTDQLEDRSAFLRSDNTISWTGTELQITSDIILDILHTTNSVATTHTLQDVPGSAQNEIQRLTLSGAATSGTFTLEFEGNTTNPINFDDANTVIETELEGLAGITDVTVTGQADAGGNIDIEFTGVDAQTNFTQITVSASTLDVTFSSVTTVQDGFNGSTFIIPINNGESLWAEIDRTQTSETVLLKHTRAESIPQHSNADKDVFVLFKRIDAGADAVLHIPLHKQALEPGQTVRLGASASTSGSGDLTFTEFAIAANVTTPTDVTGFLVNSAQNNGFQADYSLIRESSLGENAAFVANITSGFNTRPEAVAIQSDQKAVIGGGFTSFNGNTRNRLVRLNADGTEDTAFYTNLGTGFDDSVYGCDVQSDGKILVGGYFTDLNGNTRNRLVRLNSDGTEDTAFYTNLGTGFSGGTFIIPFQTVKVQSDGKILVGGTFTTFNGNTRLGLVRLNSDGTEDTAFYTNLGGFSNHSNRSIRSIEIQSDGKILVGGFFDTLNGNTRNDLVRLNSDGTEDIAFYANLGTGFNSSTNVVVQPNGRILVGGTFTTFNGNTRLGLVRLNSDGTEDTAFYTNLGTGFSTPTDISSMLVSPTTGKILVAGSFTSFNGNTRNRLVRLNSDGTEDTAFYTALGTGFNSDVGVLSFQDGKILAAGDFTQMNGNNRDKVIQLNSGLELGQQGTLRGIRKSLSAIWEIGGEVSIGEDVGVTFTMTPAGQLQYESSDDAPAGVFRFIIYRL